jgi:LmbE family N-acetylglucosaminyl deacetylase
MRHLRAPILLLVVVLLTLPLSPSGPAPAAAQAAAPPLGLSPLEPASTGGLPLVERALAKLTQHRRLLVVGAHPDDEDTSVLALVSRGLGGEAAYLSLSRGEGGQNGIGPELGVELGLLRSRELLAAREVDGARQFFTRAYDFGYTRSLEETLEKWPREVLLEDAVRVIRRFRPQVIVSIFPPGGGGHGQHQAAGVTAHEAFERAGEAEAGGPSGEGAWAPTALFRATWFDRESTTLETALGRLDPLSGRSLFQIAMASRSMHRSQDMGRVQPLGAYPGRYAWVAGPGGPESDDLFAGIDTRLEAMAAVLPTGADGQAEVRAAAAAELAAARELAEAARAGLTPEGTEGAARALVEVLARLRAALRAAAGPAGSVDPAAAPGRKAFFDLVDEKIAVAQAGLAAAAGVAVDAWTEGGIAVPGDALRVEAQVWHGERAGGRPGGEATDPGGEEAAESPADGGEGGLTVEPVAVVIQGRVPWEVAPARDEEGAPMMPVPGPLPPGELAAWAFDVTAPAEAPPTAPYFLERPLDGALYDWSAAPPELRGEPFGPPPLVVRFLLRIGGQDVYLDREVVQRLGDQAVGEVRRPLRVVPRLEVAVEPDLLVWSTAGAGEGEGPAGGGAPPGREVTVSLRSNAEAFVAGDVRLAVPEGWPEPEPVRFEIGESRGAATVSLRLTPPADLPRGHYHVEAVAELAGAPGVGGPRYREAFPVVDYPHVRATPRPEPAAVEVAAADIRLPELDAVGFVVGASEREPHALAAVGVPIVPLTGADLATRDLSRFDAVVVGSRAYETDPGLRRANGRLLDYARGGGLVIVLYQQYPFVEGGYAPYPLDIARPHDRVTEEDAPATVLVPDHPALTTPNPIGPADWEGWVQERGLYFAHTWDGAYTPLLSFPASPGFDPGELRGGLLVAEVGEGAWVYTGLAFFRQLPAGVTGAYRLFANLLALGE